jgi:hypothetical protein
MGLFIMRLQEILAKTVGRIVPYTMHLIGPILRVIVLNEQRQAMQAIIMGLSWGVTTSLGKMACLNAGRGKAA